MDGIFIRRDESIALEAGTSGGGLTLMARAGGMEIMRQKISENATVWITPAEDKETVEFFYILSGMVEMKIDGAPVLLKTGDSFYVEGLAEEVQLNAPETTELMYISNRPLFDSVFGFQDDLLSLIHQINEKDNYTLRHSWNVMEYSVRLVERLGLSVTMDNIVVASLFHDVGKCFVPDEILKSHKPLEPAQSRYIMRHPTDGGRLLRAHYSARVVEIVKNHHERLDGSGYPYGLSGDDISMEAKIVAVADVFDAMTTNRGYNKIKTFREAAEEICSLSSQFDNRVAAELLKMAEDGTIEELSKKVREDQEKQQAENREGSKAKEEV